MDYLATKYLHMSCAALSITLFTLRGGLHLAGFDWRRSRLLRFAPHLVDTILLAAAVRLAMLLSQYPFTADWLTAKLLALIAYVLLGKQALKRNNSLARCVGFLLAALASVAYIVAVAITHSASLGL